MTKKIASPTSTGGKGPVFENDVQTVFALSMLIDGFLPLIPYGYTVEKMLLQSRYKGFRTDDFTVYCKGSSPEDECKLLVQVKLSVNFTKKDPDFEEIITSAWNDFKDTSIFNKDRDQIVLVAGLLSKIDTKNIRYLLEQARASCDIGDFLERMYSYLNDSVWTKWEVFKYNLKKANNDIDVAQEDVWLFLKSFRLLVCDLDYDVYPGEDGLTRSLLYALRSKAAFLKLKDHIAGNNTCAGWICKDSIPQEIKDEFTVPPQSTMPETFIDKREPIWNHLLVKAVGFANLIGSWNENNKFDKEIIEKITGQDFSVWIDAIREIVEFKNSPIVHNSGIYQVKNRLELWDEQKTKIYDDKFSKLTQNAPLILKDTNNNYSSYLKKGISETLALMSNKSDNLSNCSHVKPRSVAKAIVKTILNDIDLWGNLSYNLPTLAETAPEEFLSVVEKQLKNNPDDFIKSGTNTYLSGLIWALEALAWNETYLARVGLIYATLSNQESMGCKNNQPFTSLINMFLPWLPHTLAPEVKRLKTIKIIVEENPEIGWDLLIQLIKSRHYVSNGTNKPKYLMSIPDDKNMSNIDITTYHRQLEKISDIAIQIAFDNVHSDSRKMLELIQCFGELRPNSIEKILSLYTADLINTIREKGNADIREAFIGLINKHARFSKELWALKPDLISKINDIVSKISPTDLILLNKYLFNDYDDSFYSDDVDIETNKKNLEQKRKNALNQIIGEYGLASIDRLLQEAKLPYIVGSTLGLIGINKDDENSFLKKYLSSKEQKETEFIKSYINRRLYLAKWMWVDSVETCKWSSELIGTFLSYLPYMDEIQIRVQKLLGTDEREYWLRMNYFRCDKKSNLLFAVDKLLEYKRPKAAIYLLADLTQSPPVDFPRVKKALLSALTSKEPSYGDSEYIVQSLIQAIQKDPNVDAEEIVKIEQKYLSILDNDGCGAEPIFIYRKLASDPKYFSKYIQTVYRPKNGKKIKTEKPAKSSYNELRVLRKWKLVPGIQKDNSFSMNQFNSWLTSVKNICNKSGHLDKALEHVGNVLFYTPPDPSGLWINKEVAKELNKDSDDSEKMRDEFRRAAESSRGAHWVDPEGRPEQELSNKYREMADAVENEGFVVFAGSIRRLSDYYKDESNKNIHRAKFEKFIY